MTTRILGWSFFYETNDIVWRTVYDSAELFQRQQSDIFVLLQGVQCFVIDAVFQEMVLRDALFCHGFPQGSIIDHLNHHLTS